MIFVDIFCLTRTSSASSSSILSHSYTIWHTAGHADPHPILLYNVNKHLRTSLIVPAKPPSTELPPPSLEKKKKRQSRFLVFFKFVNVKYGDAFANTHVIPSIHLRIMILYIAIYSYEGELGRRKSQVFFCARTY